MDNTDGHGSHAIYFAAFGWITIKFIEHIYVPAQGES